MGTPSTVYRYLDWDGRHLFSVVRHSPKRFELLGPDKRTITQFPQATVLYRLPELRAAAPDELIFVCEGEKDVDRLRSLDLVATTNPGGCRLGWKDEYTDYLRNRSVVILADNDSPGARLAESIRTSLARAEITSVILKLPRLRRAEDVSDWLDFRNGTPEELHRQVAKVFAAGRSALPPARGGHRNRHRILTSRFTTAQKMILLAIHHYSGSGGRLTVGDIADAASLHRVTAQRLLGAFRKHGIVTFTSGSWNICFDRVV
ncbi:MAG: hypothetical protein U0791_20550 [Gemmataceae bacterium]